MNRDELSHRGREGFCAKCGGACEYDSEGVRVARASTSSMSIRPLPSLAMLNHCAVCDGPAEFGIYRTVEGVEVLTAVVCGEHTTKPKEMEHGTG